MGDDNYGLTEVVPENTIAWWGARCNYDRRSYWGPGLDISMHLNAWHGEEGDVKRLKYYWSEARKDVFGAFDALLHESEYGNSIEPGVHVLHEDDTIKVAGAARGDYFYVSAWMKTLEEE
jgi:hypothetical protein|tara:strand:- start:1241 stop:1600 length:360 start_codon:yes stop_codon:yes gene_type:complete